MNKKGFNRFNSLLLILFVAVLSMIKNISSLNTTPPPSWTCNSTFYDAGDGICHCLCGAVDPDCFTTLAPNATSFVTNPIQVVGCPCSDMVCTRDALCLGSCNAPAFAHLEYRTSSVEVLSIINTALIIILIVAVLSLCAARLYEDKKKMEEWKDPNAIEDGFLDAIFHAINYVITFGNRCHAIPTIPTAVERARKWQELNTEDGKV